MFSTSLMPAARHTPADSMLAGFAAWGKASEGEHAAGRCYRMSRGDGGGLEMTLRDRLRGLASFLPTLESAAFEFGKWNNPKSSDDQDVLTLPFLGLNETAHAFVENAYDLGWVEGDFDWGAWMNTPEALSLRDSPASLAKATPRSTCPSPDGTHPPKPVRRGLARGEL